MVRAIEQRESVLQSGLAERIQQVQQRHPEIQQRCFEVQLHQEHRRRLQQVSEPEEKEAARFQGEERRGERDPARRQGEAPPAPAEGESDPAAVDAEHRIDIKV